MNIKLKELRLLDNNILLLSQVKKEILLSVSKCKNLEIEKKYNTALMYINKALNELKND